MVEHTMDMSSWLRKQLEEVSPDLLQAMVKDFAEALMSVDADAVCGAVTQHASARIEFLHPWIEVDF